MKTDNIETINVKQKSKNNIFVGSIQKARDLSTSERVHVSIAIKSAD